jgi:hypothetical protein
VVEREVFILLHKKDHLEQIQFFQQLHQLVVEEQVLKIQVNNKV